MREREKRRLDALRLIAIFLILCGIAHFYVYTIKPALLPQILRLANLEKPMTILILGSDISYDSISLQARKDLATRSDTLIVMKYDPQGETLSFLSIPRDSYVNIEGYGYQKINAAFARGGVDLTLKTIKQLTGLKIDKYLLINTQGLVKLIDILGGIEVDVPKDLYYVDHAGHLNINLKKGKQKLSGKQAEGFVRFRMDLMGDISRIERQQLFMNAFFKAAFTPSVLFKAPFIFQIITRNVSSNLALKDFILLANTLRMRSNKTVFTATAPGEPTYNEAGSVWLINRPDLEALLKRMF